MNLPLFFVLPTDEGFLSGGNLYNHHLLQALRSRASGLEVADPETASDRLDRNPEAVVVVDSAVLDVVPDLADRSRGPLLVLVHHLTSFETTIQAAEARAREDDLLRGAHGFIAYSPFTRNALRERFGPSLPILNVPPALAVVPSVETPSVLGDPTRCLVVGNVIRRKGVLDLLDRLAERLLPEDTFTLHVVGSGALEADYFQACRARIETTPALRSRIELVGEVSPEEMQSWYNRSSVLVSASEVETYGMALAEARAFGLLILALRGGHVAAHLPDDDHGLLFDSLDGLADGLLSLARSPEDLRRRVLRAQGVRKVDGYDWEHAAESLLEQLHAHLDHGDFGSH